MSDCWQFYIGDCSDLPHYLIGDEIDLGSSGTPPDLPRELLFAVGYPSVGCTHCSENRMLVEVEIRFERIVAVRFLATESHRVDSIYVGTGRRPWDYNGFAEEHAVNLDDPRFAETIAFFEQPLTAYKDGATHLRGLVTGPTRRISSGTLWAIESNLESAPESVRKFWSDTRNPKICAPEEE